MFDTIPNSRQPIPDSQPHVVLVDEVGLPTGTASKATVHGTETPLHLGFSCYVVRPDGSTLLTRRAAAKRTWPGTWTNACCGHPRHGETLRQAVERHLRDELGLTPTRIALAIGDFTYRATMADGTVEHELCPVMVAEVEGELTPDPGEVDAAEWIDWNELVARAGRRPESLSPWSVDQIGRLATLAATPIDLIGAGDPADRILDRPAGRRRWLVGSGSANELDHTRARVDEHLGEFIAARRHDVLEAADAMTVLHSAIEALTGAGGKRLRPAFVIWGHLAAGGDPAAAAPLHAAGAVELLHTFALLHDDVMDRSATRRGRPTAHHELRAHAANVDDAEWFGVSAAVLAGDLAFVWADRLFDEIDAHATGSGAARHARRLFTTLRTEVIAGQYLDIHRGCSATADETDAARIALLKSARYTASRPLQIGAALAGADDALSERLARFGDAAGMAFQLRDDVLGVFGDPGSTGKSAADDLREGKRTLLVQRAMALTTDAGRAVLCTALGTPDLDEVSAKRCRDVIAASGALASVEAAIDVHLERAFALASTFEPDAGRVLSDLAELAARRDR
jgi:geranylgeranyl diphosphate synthase type I